MNVGCTIFSFEVNFSKEIIMYRESKSAAYSYHHWISLLRRRFMGFTLVIVEYLHKVYSMAFQKINGITHSKLLHSSSEGSEVSDFISLSSIHLSQL